MICLEPTCSDGLQNGNETDVDCGGVKCLPCKNNKKCEIDSDCTSEICDKTRKICSGNTIEVIWHHLEMFL